MDADGAPRICLSMIVRNEAHIIERCVRAAAPWIDAAVICDTGSTDGTPRRVHDCLDARRIPVRVRDHVWRDFGTNRTAAIHEARNFVESRGWPLDRTYWLFLDADLELVAEAGFDRRRVRGDGALLRQRHGTQMFWNLRLARADLDWRAVGPTHETYVAGAPAALERLAGVWVRDHGDGGSKQHKTERDITLLTERLAQAPDDTRALFYLAQSYRAAGAPLKALILYRRRIAGGGRPDEVWYSQFAIGQILAAGGDLDQAVAALDAAHRLDPARAEPLYELARLYRTHDRHGEAARLADQARRLPVPDGPKLIVHCDVYEFGADLELMRSAWDTSDRALGADACERLALSRRAPADVVAEARTAAARYAEPLAGCEFLRLTPPLPAPYAACNPSLLRTADGYLVNCRAVNYRQRRLRYWTPDADGIFHTRNVLMRLDREFNVLDQHDLVLEEPPLRDTRVRGLEDCRLFATRDGTFVLCTTADRHPDGRVHQSLCRIAEDGRLVDHRPLAGSFAGPQKNWLPFTAADGTPRVVYAWDPLTILRVSASTGRYEIEREVPHGLDARHWRGSAGPIPWPTEGGDRQWLLIHEAVRRLGPDGLPERIYLHRWVECDAAFALTRVSRPFVFAHKGVEFACGMTLDHDGTHLIVGLGIEDREAYLCRIPVARVRALLADGDASGVCGGCHARVRLRGPRRRNDDHQRDTADPHRGGHCAPARLDDA